LSACFLPETVHAPSEEVVAEEGGLEERLSLEAHRALHSGFVVVGISLDVDGFDGSLQRSEWGGRREECGVTDVGGLERVGLGKLDVESSGWWHSNEIVLPVQFEELEHQAAEDNMIGLGVLSRVEILEVDVALAGERVVDSE